MEVKRCVKDAHPLVALFQRSVAMGKLSVGTCMAILVLVIELGCLSGCSSTSPSRSNTGSYAGGSADSHAGHNH